MVGNQPLQELVNHSVPFTEAHRHLDFFLINKKLASILKFKKKVDPVDLICPPFYVYLCILLLQRSLSTFALCMADPTSAPNFWAPFNTFLALSPLFCIRCYTIPLILACYLTYLLYHISHYISFSRTLLFDGYCFGTHRYIGLIYSSAWGWPLYPLKKPK